MERYDPDRGFRLSTYVYWWIRQAITRAIAYQGRTIRLPMRTLDALYKINSEIKKYMVRHRPLPHSCRRTSTEVWVGAVDRALVHFGPYD